MIYEVGGVIVAKKAHACGGEEWQVLRTGADVKLKCLKCGRVVFASVDETKKMTKKYIGSDKNDG
ncbi:MAG: DUF951 domain-containing protein [Clostridia bacterium]|nr:DUF951 domain-containing protein [Clostridia bacterium]